MKSPRYHVIIDLTHAQSERIRDKNAITAFLQEVVDGVGMKIISGPTVAEGVPENPGLSGFAILDYSHAAVHTFTESDEVMVDIFSCKPFDRQKAREMVLAAFATKDSDVRSQEIWWQSQL